MADDRRNDEKGIEKAAAGGEGSSEEKEAVEEKEDLCRKVYLDRPDKDEEEYVIVRTGPRAYHRLFQNKKDCAHYSDLEFVKETLDILKGLCTDEEIMMIGISCPRTCEETYQLMPSLRDKRELIEAPLKEVVLPTLLKHKVEIGKIKK